MRIRFLLTVTAIALVVGCGDDRKSPTEPEATTTPAAAPEPAPAGVATDASETELAAVNCPSPDLPPPEPGDTAIEAATYTVCSIGDLKDEHMSDGAMLSKKHLEIGDAVTICELGEAVRLKLSGRQFNASAFLDGDKVRQLKGLDFFRHDGSLLQHLVKITRNNASYPDPVHEGAPQCDAKQNQIIRIQFCNFGPSGTDPTEKWRCPGEGPGEIGAHQGDIHAQN